MFPHGRPFVVIESGTTQPPLVEGEPKGPNQMQGRAAVGA